MGKLQRIWKVITGAPDVPYVDESKDDDQKLSVKDMLNFMERQQNSTAQMMAALAQASLAQAETMKTYIDLFKPREVKSTTLEEREFAREAEAKVRESEWEGIADAPSFNKLLTGTSDGIPPDLGEW